MATNLIDVELNSPYQNQPIGPTGLNLSEAIGTDPVTFGQQVGDAEMASQFAVLLDKGTEGMAATAEQMLKEGSITPEQLQKIDPNLPAFQTQDGQVKWYKTVTALAKQNADKASLEEIAETEDPVEAATLGFKKGLGKETAEHYETVSAINLDQNVQDILEKISESRARQKGGEIVDGQEGTEGQEDDPWFIYEPQLQSGSENEKAEEIIKALSSRNKMISHIEGLGVGHSPQMKSFLKTLKDENKSYEQMFKQFYIQTRHDEKLSYRKGEDAARATAKFFKDTADIRPLNNHLNKIDSLLKSKFGMPGGLYSKKIDPGVDLPLAGLMGDKGKRFAKGDRARLQTLINLVFTDYRHQKYGAALTGTELKNFNTLVGNQFLGNEEIMVNALRGMMEGTREMLKSPDPRVWKKLRESGTFIDHTPDSPGEDLGSPTDEPKDDENIVDVDLTKKSSDDDIKKYLKDNGYQVTKDNIKYIRGQLK